jgi:hypothetical protein
VSFSRAADSEKREESRIFLASLCQGEADARHRAAGEGLNSVMPLCAVQLRALLRVSSLRSE